MDCYDVEISVNPEEDFEIVIAEGIFLFYEKERRIVTLEFDQAAGLGAGRDSRSVSLEKCEFNQAKAEIRYWKLDAPEIKMAE